MTTALSASLRRVLITGFLCLAACLWFALPARAGLTFVLEFSLLTANDGTYYYAFNPWSTTTNATAPAAPYGDYFMVSPGYPSSNEVSALFHYDSTNGFGLQNAGYNYIYDFADIMGKLTNGNWTIYFTNLNTTNVTIYNFKVTAPGFTTNSIPNVFVTSPTNDATITNRNSTFTWQGPTNYDSLNVSLHTPNNSNPFQSATLPASQTSWSAPVTLPYGTNIFTPQYIKNSDSIFVVTIPRNASSNAISAWSSTNRLTDSYDSQFIIPFLPSSVGFTNVMHYTFDDGSNAGQDTSSNHFDINCGSDWGPTTDVASTNAVAGGNARQFYGYSSQSVGCGQTVTFDAWTNVFGGSFSVSAWVNTTTTVGSDGDNWDDFSGQSLIYVDDYNGHGTSPIGFTGSKVAFFTGDSFGNQDTLHSISSVTTGHYVHIVVTRDGADGEKKIYVNGMLEATDSDSAEVLTGNLGAPGNGSESIGGTPNSPYTGLVDDVQIYSGILTSSDVTYLYQNPGSVAVSVVQDFNAALETTNLTWTTSGDATWFVETTNTDSDFSAAQSGNVINNQTSVLSTTVTGPGTLTFHWKNDSNGNLDLEFDIDGNYQDDITGITGWSQDGDFTLSAGQHTLTWTTIANGDSTPLGSGYLDQVNFFPYVAPVIALNPFNQTNYPGYPVGLIAAVTASNDTSIAWQWYKLGSGAITNATNAFFTPTNSGTASVAGGYYAVASNPAGYANTTTAVVNFVNAPLPPDWARAFKSPFQAQDSSQVTTDFYYNMAVDATGNLYAAAEFGGNMTIGSSNLNSGTGGDAAALVKQSPTGAPIWVAGITNNGGGSAYGQNVTLAPGGVYFSGNYNGTNWLGTNKLSPNSSGGIFLGRFDTNGSNIWLKTYGTTNTSFTTINCLVADPAGNVTVAALFGAGPISIGTNNFTIDGQEGLVFQLNAAGTVVWAQKFSSEFVQHMAYSAGRLYASFGTFTNAAGTNAVIGNVTNSTDRAWAIASLNYTNGQPIWIRGVAARSGSDANNPYALGVIDDVPRIAVSGSDVFLVGAAYDSNALFGSITVNFNSLRGQYFARYDTNGTVQIATTYGSPSTTPRCIIADTNGNVYVDGLFDNFSFFGNDMIAAPRNVLQYTGDFGQAFLAKFDRNGNALWARMAVAPSTVNFLGIALASDGVWASGWCRSTNTASGYTPTAFGTNNVYGDTQVITLGSSVVFVGYAAGVLAKITDVTIPSLAVTLGSQGLSGTNYQFNFISTAGHTNQVQYSTNLATHTWLVYTNIVGDGTLKTISVPAKTPVQKFFRVITQ